MYESIVKNAKIKLALTSDSDDAVLSLYARDAVALVNEIRNYSPNVGDEPFERKFEGVVEDMVVEVYQKRGAEGDISNSTNGVTRNFASTTFSPALLQRITPVVRVRI